MLAETIVFLAFTLFQVVGAVVLIQRRTGPTGPMRILAALLLLNATLSAISALRSAGHRTPGIDAFEHVVDLPTASLLVAFFFARSSVPRKERWVWAALGAGALQMAASFAWPLMQTTYYVPAIAFPYYAAVTLVVVACAWGATWEKWVALAFLPRVYYFATQALFDVSSTGEHAVWGIWANHLGVYAMALACLVAVWRVARDDVSIPRAVLLGGLAVGPAMAMAQAIFPSLTDSANAVLNFVSLGLVRPLFQYVGVAPDALPSIVARSTLSSGVAGVVAAAGPFLFGYPDAFCAMLGLGAGLLAVAIAEAVGSGVRLPEPPAVTPPAPPPGPGGSGPQWQRLLLELRGSSSHEGPGRLAWTQKELSRRTGISVQRVSEFPSMMNGSASQKLDALVPGWRAEHPEGAPTLVEVHKGAVEGVPGVRVYYRLTGWGERLASSIVLTDSEVGSSLPEDSARIPGHV